jgi:hypothetical protein
MERLATVRWRTPAPTAIDEELAVYDDGSAWLVVRCSRTGDALVGTWATTPALEDHAALVAGGDVLVDLLSADGVPEAAERVAGAARSGPLATVAFHAGATGEPVASLAAVGGGTREVRFAIDPDTLVVHVERDGATVAWFEVAPLETGFMTPGAEGLGGVRRRAAIAPGDFGAIALDVPGLEAAPGDAVVVQVAGWLYDALPDAPEGEPFRVRTAPTTVPG